MKPLRGLYAITSEALCASPERLLSGVAAALRGGAALIQYRDKWNPQPLRQGNAQALQQLCGQFQVPLIINDGPPAFVADGGFDGLHLGQGDATLAEARRLLTDQLIGVSCANSLERALAAQDAGASYVAFGRFYPSRTKPEAPPATPELLRAARERLKIPLCAIGGITPANAAPLLEAGASLIAAVDGVFGATDIESAARDYSRLFN